MKDTNHASRMKPIIGVVPLYDEFKDSLWMVPGYMDGITQAGGLPVMLPLTKDQKDIARFADEFDGFLFTGGHDVTPAVYGEERLPVCGACCKERDEMERELFDRVTGLDKPLLGICRGIQLINALLGGTLYQDLPTQHPSLLEHHMKPPYDRPAHHVHILPDTPLAALLGAETIAVNSYHHQAVRDTAPSLRVMAKADDGIVEGVYLPGRKMVWAIQWHPEFSFTSDENSRRIFAHLVNQSAGKS